MSRLSERASRFRILYLAPVLALLCLAAWSLASPMGSSTDDDFHLISTWCAPGSSQTECAAGASPGSRIVPEALEAAPCFAGDPTISAACQYDAFDLDPTPTEETVRGNFAGTYPPAFYSVMHLFVTDDILLSVVVMRLVNALLFIGLTATLFALLPPRRRPALVWSWLLCTVPLGLFLIASNNPSSWAIIGVGTAWLALLAYYETTGKRRVGLAVVFAVATIMAAGSRSDSAAYVCLAIAAVVFLRFQPTKRFLVHSILPAAGVLAAAASILSSRQSLSAVNGFSGGTSPTGIGEVAVERTPLGLFFSNLVNVPSLWAGIFGSYPLGWFDTPVPEVVFLGALGCFVGVVFRALGVLTRRTAISLAAITGVLVALPLFVLQRGMDSVGQEVQPRYLLPLIVVLAGIAMLTASERGLRLSRAQWMLVAATLSVAQSVSLYFTLRRFVNGNQPGGFVLDTSIKWWWEIPVSPLFVLAVGSLAYAALVFVLLGAINRPAGDRSPDRPHPAISRQS